MPITTFELRLPPDPDEPHIPLNEAKQRVGKGWSDLVEWAYDVLDGCGREYKVAVVKEKFGRLRIYFDIVDSSVELDALAVYNRVEGNLFEIESQSLSTCESCGAPGTCGKATQFLIKTLCEACRTGFETPVVRRNLREI